MKSKVIFIVLLTFSCKVHQTSTSKKSEIYLEDGVASWYGPGFHGKTTANGEQFDTNDFTAAHRTAPFGTKVKVVNQSNGKFVIVRINDRGPYAKNRIIDLSQAAAKRIEMIENGTANVTLYLLGQEFKDLDVENIKAPTYTIQIGSFADQTKAITESNKHKDGWVDKSQVKGKLVYRVYVGKFTSVQGAINRKKELPKLTGFIKQIEN